MSNFALVNNNSGEVYNLVKADQDYIDSILENDFLTGADFSWIEFLDDNRAFIGGAYDSDLEKFIQPKPYTDWILNQITFLWESPEPEPISNINHHWYDIEGVWIANDNQT